MTLNDVMALILRYFTEFGSYTGAHCVKVVEDFVVKSSRSLSHLTSFLFNIVARHIFATGEAM